MQVKKFEARSMKEALEMVKNQLGPEAIILSARDNSRRYGLVGQGSVEITAAVSEETLKKKQFVESRLREQDRDRLRKSPARQQKEVIEKMVTRYMDEQAPGHPITQTRYIEIEDESAGGLATHGNESAGERIRTAAQRAWDTMQSHDALMAGAGSVSPQPPMQHSEPAVIQSLKSELSHLKQVLAQFQNVPQSMSGAHPGAEYGLPYDFSGIFEKLTQSGVDSEIVGEILTEAQAQMPPVKFKNRALVDAWVARYILSSTKVVEENSGTQMQIFVGPAGSGKTSTLVKLASHYVVNHKKKVALVTADTQKVGAADQLRIYAQILNVPFAIVRNAMEWKHIQQQLRDYDYILCDFPGMSLKTLDEITFFKNILPKDQMTVTSHLVLSSLAKDQDLTEVGKRYKIAHFNDVIFTGLDDSAQHGPIYNFMKRFAVPLHSFGIGSRVPEDFEMATRERVLDLIFKLTKVKKS